MHREHGNPWPEDRRRRKPMPTPVKVVAAVLGLVLLGLLIALAYVGVRPPYIFFPDTVVSFRPNTVNPPIAYQDLTLTAPDGVEISAWWMPVEGEDAPTILFLHGGVGDLGDRLTWIRLAVDGGFNVLALDYRGYGVSSGSPTVGGLYRDAEAGYRWLTETQGVLPEDIIILGQSLGGAVASQLAQRREAGLLVLESTFTHIADLVREQAREGMAARPPAVLTRIVYWNANLNSLYRISGIDEPILILHSREDEFVPFAHAERLAEAAGDQATLTEVRGRHNSVIDATQAAYFVSVRSAFAASRARQ